MRYLGNKSSLLNFIDQVLAMHGLVPDPSSPLNLCDPFTGTASVARHLKRQGWRVVSGDIMAYSYAFQQAYIAANEAPSFSGITDAGVLDPDLTFPVPLYRVIAHLNNLRGVEGSSTGITRLTARRGGAFSPRPTPCASMPFGRP